MQHLLCLSRRALADWLTERGLRVFRAAQIWRWLWVRRAREWDEMTDLPKVLRRELAHEFPIWSTRIARHTQAADGTEKLLLELVDGESVECVLLRDGLRRTICISTQAGCGMGCVFCASGLNGLARNLTNGEIVEQMLRLDRLLSPVERLSHIVVMGMGEPLANLDALLPALAEASSEHGLGISARRITISTVGIPVALRRLTEENARYRLAVSLHAPNDDLRNTLVPVNSRMGLDAILREADHYFGVSGRRLTYEYVLLGGINDAPHHARQLAQLLKGREALVNLIPYNPVAGLPYRTPTTSAREAFRRTLEEAGIRVKIRHRKGDEIDAACGQLRRSAHSAAMPLGELSVV